MSPNSALNMSEHQATSFMEISSDGESPASNCGLIQTDEEFVNQQLFFVTSYSDFDKLAHGPRGHIAKHTLRVYQFQTDGSLVLLNISGERSQVINPAFSRFHPRLNVVYTCTEDIEENGQILAYGVHPDGSLTEIDRIDAGGTSTCYLTIDREQRHLIAVNYWDSTLVVIPLSKETGEFAGPIHNIYDPKAGKKMIAAAKKHGGVNHSNNDASTIAQRQVDPHSHALVLDPFEGCVAYVPDLGKDLIREIFYDSKVGMLGCEFSMLPSGMSTDKPDGPRYIDFHPKLNVAYVVNELSSTIAVFSVDKELLSEISRASKKGLPMDQFKGRSTLKLIQSIKTVPSAFPVTMNTCGRICVHQSGRFVVVSNRGHESITVLRVKQGCSSKEKATRGTLAQVGFFHTRGETPRHFQFDHSGQFLIVANQDSDSIAVFSFNLTSGEIKYTGHDYRVPSPNFVCCCPVVDRYSDVLVTDVLSIPPLSRCSIPDSVQFNPIHNELELARKEIAGLKLQLSSLTG
ncbi:hypothetical protein ACHAW5_003586 [Stephanodiscus triporus]|uniref:Uncharacterized protein n=1 Tax=Stephanodiscus triporus TaxID=2934178 RepID=A0ABD3MZQ4_9STRA